MVLDIKLAIGCLVNNNNNKQANTQHAHIVITLVEIWREVTGGWVVVIAMAKQTDGTCERKYVYNIKE